MSPRFLQNSRCGGKAVCAAFLSAALVFGSLSAQADGDVGTIAVQDFGNMVTFAGGTEKAGGRIKVRIDGPDGLNVFEATSDSGLVDWDLKADLPDGLYQYDVWFSSETINTELKNVDGNSPVELKAAENVGTMNYQSGTVRVQGGYIVSHHKNGLEISGLSSKPSVLERIVGGILDFAIPAASAGVAHGTDDVTIDGTFPAIFFDDTDVSGAPNYQLLADDAGYYFATPLVTPFFISRTAPGNSIWIEANTGDVGMGTSTPQGDLHIVDTFPEIELTESDQSDAHWNINVDGTNLEFDHVGTPNFNDAITISPDGKIGMGGSTGNNPDAALHLRRTDGTAEIFVEEVSGTAAPRVLYRMYNNGAPILNFRNNNAAMTPSWTYSVTDAGGFRINASGSGAPVEMDLFGGGDMIIGGTLTEGSSRAIKDGIVPVDNDTILAKLEALPISEWNYTGRSSDRHVGPMAEDFHAMFGLGPDDKHVAPKDLAGVALAAAKALKTENDVKSRRLAELEADKVAREARINQLEARLARLEALLEQE